jgi:hypothetical protein
MCLTLVWAVQDARPELMGVSVAHAHLASALDAIACLEMPVVAEVTLRTGVDSRMGHGERRPIALHQETDTSAVAPLHVTMRATKLISGSDFHLRILAEQRHLCEKLGALRPAE